MWLGIDEAKEEVVEIIEFLKDPPKFQKLWRSDTERGSYPWALLAQGRPSWRKQFAGEAGVPFFSISGSDFVEMSLVSRGLCGFEDLFEQGKENAPASSSLMRLMRSGDYVEPGWVADMMEREQDSQPIAC